MSDIFKEVDEALQKDKVEEFWNNYGSLMIVLIILLIAAVGGYSAYSAWEISKQKTQTKVLIDFSKQPTEFDRDKLNELSADQGSIAYLMAARVALTDEKYQDAFNDFKAVANTITADKNLRGLAAYYARNMILDAKVTASFQDISLPDNTIWASHYSFQDALKLGSFDKNYEGAIAKLDTIILNQEAPRTLVQQSEQLKYVYEHDMKQEGK